MRWSLSSGVNYTSNLWLICHYFIWWISQDVWWCLQHNLRRNSYFDMGGTHKLNNLLGIDNEKSEKRCRFIGCSASKIGKTCHNWPYFTLLVGKYSPKNGKMCMRQQRGIFAIVVFTIRNIFLYQPQPCGLSTWKKAHIYLPWEIQASLLKL